MIQQNGFTELKAIQNLESNYSTVSELKFSHMTAQEEAGCQFNVNRWHWANKAGETLKTHIVYMKMGNRAGSQSLFRKAAQKNKIKIRLSLDFLKRERFGFTNLLLERIEGFMVFCFVVFCDHDLKAFLQMIIHLQRNRDYWEPNGTGKQVNSNEVAIRRVLTFPRKTYPAMAAPISVMTMRERRTAN